MKAFSCWAQGHQGQLESIPAFIRRRQSYTLDLAGPHGDKQSFTLTSTPNIESPIDLTCKLNAWKLEKLENLGRTHADPTKKVPGPVSDPRPSCFEAAVATTGPLCRPTLKTQTCYKFDCMFPLYCDCILSGNKPLC